MERVWYWIIEGGRGVLHPSPERAWLSPVSNIGSISLWMDCIESYSTQFFQLMLCSERVTTNISLGSQNWGLITIYQIIHSFQQCNPHVEQFI